MRLATSRGSRLLGQLRRSCRAGAGARSARPWLRASRRADSSAVAAWSARIMSSRMSSVVELVQPELRQGDDADDRSS